MVSSGCVEDDALLIFAHEKGATTSRLGRHRGFISEKKDSVVVSCDETTAASLCSIIKRQELIPSFLPSCGHMVHCMCTTLNARLV